MTKISALIKEVGELRAMVEVSEAKQDQIEEEAACQAEQRAAEIAALKATTAQCSKALIKTCPSLPYTKQSATRGEYMFVCDQFA